MTHPTIDRFYAAEQAEREQHLLSPAGEAERLAGNARRLSATARPECPECGDPMTRDDHGFWCEMCWEPAARPAGGAA
jgi:hypothetical protein